MPNGPFKPGEQAPITGIYCAMHDRHRAFHDVFAAKGDLFPSCRKCDDRVRFALVQPANQIDCDPDFRQAGMAKKTSAGKLRDKT